MREVKIEQRSINGETFERRAKTGHDHIDATHTSPALLRIVAIRVDTWETQSNEVKQVTRSQRPHVLLQSGSFICSVHSETPPRQRRRRVSGGSRQTNDEMGEIHFR